jgi:chromosome segregation ATPase
MQNELEKCKPLSEDVKYYQQVIEDLKKAHVIELQQMTEIARATVKAKKQKYITKIKELETRFITMCEDKMKQIQGNFKYFNKIDDLKNSTEHQLKSLVIEKETEISRLQTNLENDYLPISDHENIVNENITKFKSEHNQEIEKLCDQFEKEFFTTQEEFEEEKEIIRNEFREQVNSLNQQVENMSQQYSDTKDEYQTVVQKIADIRQENDKLKNEIDKLSNDLTNAYKSNSTEVKDLEESIYNLNNELNDKNKLTHKLELQKEKAEKFKDDAELICKNATSALDKKLKTLTLESEEKIKQVVALNIDLKQKSLKTEENIKETKKDLNMLKNDHDGLVTRYDVLNHQHQCLVKESDDKEEYMNILQSRLKTLKSSKRSVIQTVTKAVNAK